MLRVWTSLAPGSCLGSWAWSKVTPQLRAAGHDVHPVTLTGFGDRAHLADRDKTNFDTHVRDVLATLATNDLSDVVLVGHSYAGAVVTAAAARVPERIERLVYVAGLVPPSGATLFDAQPDSAAIMQQYADQYGDGWLIPVPPDEILDTYYGDHGLEGQTLAWFRAHTQPHPIATYQQRIDYDVAAWEGLDRVYIRSQGDVGPSPVKPGQAGWHYEELPTGHWPMFTLPDQTAALIDEVSR